MKFCLRTLADITETNARRGEGDAYKQQQNYMTVIQTISLRSNVSTPVIEKETVALSNLGFGSKYKGTKTVWTLYFEIESDHGHSIELLKTDFDLIPFIPNLEENVKFEKAIFYTQNNELTNIIFEEIDK